MFLVCVELNKTLLLYKLKQLYKCLPWEFINQYHSLGPRPHPLTRGNGLVNQVKFLGLVHTVVTVSSSNVEKFYAKPAQKKLWILE